jgi:hypothetical protein
MVNKAMLTLKLVALAGVIFAATAGAQNGDSANILSIVGVTGPLSQPIPPKKPFTFKASVHYSLGSHDAAVLQVGVEEFAGPAQGANGCLGSVHSTNGGSSKQIARGSGDVNLDVTWNGQNSTYGDKTQFVGLFVTFSDPQTNQVFKTTFPPSSNQCFAVGYAL